MEQTGGEEDRTASAVDRVAVLDKYLQVLFAESFAVCKGACVNIFSRNFTVVPYSSCFLHLFCTALSVLQFCVPFRSVLPCYTVCVPYYVMNIVSEALVNKTAALLSVRCNC